MGLPSGTVTFLFTDIEGSTKLWEQHPEAMCAALARHDAILKEAIEANNGHVFKTIGDAFCAAFSTASDALSAALTAQRYLQSEAWEGQITLRARIALHTGAAQERDEDYFGPALNRVARLLSLGHGGQTLLSLATRLLLPDCLPEGAGLKDMGAHRLRDLSNPEQVFQLLHPDLPSEFPPLKSLNALPTNLPAQLTSFIGREKEIQTATRLLAEHRLLTLTGAGGCGKTRLACQIAADLLDTYPDGAWLVELASLADPSLVAQAVASTLAIKEEPGRPLLQTLAEGLRSRKLLLLLDNCEHLLAACAFLCETLLKACPDLRVLATSREGLNMPGETVYRVPSLSLPAPGNLPSLDNLYRYEAVHLFVERALLSQPGFAVTGANAPALAQVCARLDGIPLAIELAAARVRVMPVEQIATRLDDRFRLLTGGSRAALPRQQTLKALIDWSYDLLSEPERRLLARLSVFAGGWTLDAAEAVCASEALDAWEILDLLTGLVDKSLVIYEDLEGAARYRLLETVRQYARDRLQESGGAETARDRHQDYFLALAEEAAPQLMGPEQSTWLNRLESDHDNLRAALDRCLEEGAGSEAGLRLAGALQRFWAVRGYFSEGSQRYTAVLAYGSQEPTAARALALHGAGNMVYSQSDFPAATAYYEQALAVREQLRDRNGMAGSLGSLGNVAQYQGDYERARALFEQSLDINRETGNRTWEATNLICLGSVCYDMGDHAAVRSYYEQALSLSREIGARGLEANTLNSLGVWSMEQGDNAQAQDYLEQSIAVYREIGDRGNATVALSNLGNIARDRGDYPAARAYYKEATEILHQLGNHRLLAVLLECFAYLELHQAHSERAARVWGAANSLREAIGAPLPPVEREEYESSLANLRENLGESAFSAAWAEGSAMTGDQAARYVLDGP